MGLAFMRRQQAGDYLFRRYGFCSPRTLAKLACITTAGPPFRKVGRMVLYDPADLDEWALKQMSAPRRSTSETKSLS